MQETGIAFQYEEIDARERERMRAENKALIIPLAHALVAVGLVVILLLAFWLEPDPRGLGTHQQLLLFPCNFYALTGFPCPFCGITTAFAHMARGEVRDAFLAQPIGALGFAACVMFLPLAIAAAISGKNLLGALAKLRWEKLSWMLGALVLISWLFKLTIVAMH